MRFERFLSVVTIIVLISLAACTGAPAPAAPPVAAPPAAAEPAQAVQAQAATATTEPTQPAPTPTREPLPPTVVSISPARGQEQLVSAPVVVTFDQPMDAASTGAAFDIEPQVPGEVEVAGDTLTFTPAEPLARGQEYRVKLASAATSASGLALQREVAFRFVTAGYLQVTNTQPTDGTDDVATDTPIVVAFNRPVVPLTGGGDQAGLPQPLVITPTVTGAGEWINTSTYQFTPEDGLAASTSYTVTVEAGLTDTTGGVLAEPYTFRFHTTDPAVVRWLPENNLKLRIEKPISVTFSMPMDRPSTEAAFKLADAEGPVAGTFTWNADATEMAFKPTEVLKFGRRYTASLDTTALAANGLGTLRDNGLLSYALQTVPLPQIISTEPRNGNTAVSPDTSVRFQFAGPMNPTSFVSDTITILPKPTRVFTYYNDYEDSLFIDFQKAPATDYTITLSGKVADLYGNTLGEDYVLKFRTRNLDPMLQLNNMGIVGTYSAYTDTQAVVAYRNMPEVRFDLYRVNQDELIDVSGRDFWGNWDRFRPQPDARVREWAVPTKAEPNRLGYIREPLVDADGSQLTPGVYWLEVTGLELPNGQRPPRQLIVRTDLNVTVKASEEEVLAWVTDLQSGQPVEGVTVRVADNAQNDLTGTTGADGVARIKLTSPRKVWESIIAIATTDEGSFGAASINWADGIAPWEFGLSSGQANEPYVGYVYTDRPIYRPGQTVYWKAILRRNNDVQYTLPPAGQPVSVTISDSAGNTLADQRLTVNALGAVDGQLELGPDATLGYYFVSLRLPLGNKEEASLGVGFQVAEYRKPEYELSATTDKPEYIQGEQIRGTVQADYFFGGPVKNARVRWTALASDAFFTYRGEGYYSFSDWDWWNPASRSGPWGGEVSQGEGRTDDQGRFTFTLPADITKYFSSQRFTLDISVFDANNQVVSTQAYVVIHKGEFYIGVKPSAYVVKAGAESQVDVLTVDPQSQPVADVEVDLVVNQVEWRSVREQAEDGQFYWVTRPKYTPVVTETVTTDANGVAALKWTPPAAGEYKVEASARDSMGHALRSAAFIWVSGADFVPWRQENNDRIKLVADKDEYEIGETAEILIPSPYQGSVKALVTLERGRILSHEVIDLTSNSQVMRVPITAEYAPNLFVSVIIMQGIDANNPRPSFKVGMVPLKVSVASKALQIVLTPRDASAAPGVESDPSQPLRLAPRAKVIWEVETLDAAGKPVAADVSLALVDKAVLTLAQDQSGKLLDRFYSQRGLSVSTGVTLALNVDRLVAQLAEEGKGGGGGGGDGGIDSVRTEFPDIAYWRASVTTNEEGVATVEVTLPDNLTTWVMDARAATESTLVGQNMVEVIATKSLLVRPVLPRFFVAGDQAEIAGIIHNTTADDLEVRIALSAGGLDVMGDTGSAVTVPAGGTYKAVWPVAVQADAAEVKVRMTADSGSATTKLSDAVEITLPVERYSTPEVVGTSGRVEADTDVLELVRLPASIDATRGDLTVNIEPSLAAGMVGGLTYLEHYPYECIEQTVSRFLPNVVSYQALQDLDIERPGLDTKLAQQVGVGLQRIYARQHIDGGWGWWEKDDSNPTVSAYVLFGLARAQQAGFTVDADVMARAADYLRGTLAAAEELTNWQLNRQAFTVYALAEAGQPEPNRAGALYEQRERLDNFGKAYLALALNLIGDEAAPERIKTLLADLSGRAIVSATTAHWEEAQPDYWNMNTDTRSTAVVLAALAKLDPENALGPNVVRWLMTARQGDAWQTTQENAWAIIGLTEWMAATGELEGNYDWQVQVNGASLGEGTVTPQTVQDVTQLKADITQLLLDQTNGVVISRSAAAGQSGAGQLYYTLHLRTYEPVQQVAPRSRGLTVTREYRLADCVQTQETALELLPACPPVTKAKVGDVLQARVTLVVPNYSHFVIVEDPLPAGTEAIDTSLRITSQTAQGPEMSQESEQDMGWWWTPTHVELRDEKAVLFATNLEPGTYTFTYQVRATLPGTFLTLPPTAYQMYAPEVWGRGAGSTFVVTE